MTMTRIAAVLAIGALVLVGCSATQAQDQLFNGKDLDNWGYYLVNHEALKQDVWSVKDGMIICKGDPFGYLYTRAAYKDFLVRLEYRWAPGQKPGNSGVFLRINGKPSFLPRCYECQLQQNNAGDLYAFQGMKISGPADRLRHIKHETLGDFDGVKKMTGNEKEPGQWNVVEIMVHQDTVEVRVNDKVVNEARGLDDIAGHIGLQSEGGEIHFRNVTVRPVR